MVFIHSRCGHASGALTFAEKYEEARQAFETAVTTARRQGAMLFLLRATRDLARLLAQDGERDFARDLLEPIVREFPEHRTGLDFLEAELFSQLN